MRDGDLRSLFRQHLPDFHWQAIETGMVGRGIPDSNYCHNGVEGWIEYKNESGWRVSLRPEQVGWLLRRHRAGGRTYVAVRRRAPGGPRRGDAADELWLFAGSAARELKLYGLVPNTGRPPDRALLGRWSGGPARWDWGAVAAALTGG